MDTALKMVTKSQIKLIHALVHACGYTEAEYRVMLYMNCKVTSSKFLTFEQAGRFIDAMEEKAIEAGVWTKIEGTSRFRDLGNRPGMATPAQLRMIEAMWRDISDANIEESRQKGLRVFLFNRFHVSDLRFIEEARVTGILNALRHIKERKNARRVKGPQTREALQPAYDTGEEA